MKKAPFRTCPVCGCALDPGERCDCADTASASDRAAAETTRLTPPERAYYGRHFEGERGSVLVERSVYGLERRY